MTKIDLDIKISGKGTFHVAQDDNGKIWVSDVTHTPGPTTHEPDITFGVDEVKTKQWIRGEWKEGAKEPTVTGGLPGSTVGSPPSST